MASEILKSEENLEIYVIKSAWLLVVVIQHNNILLMILTAGFGYIY